MIQIVRGVYGYLDSDGIVRPKTKADAPFSLTAEQEARLVGLGVAKYVGAAALPEEPAEEPEALSERSVKELREIGKEYGLSFKVGATKADMIQAIEEAQSELEEASDEEPAPVFDASEAVQ